MVMKSAWDSAVASRKLVEIDDNSNDDDSSCRVCEPVESSRPKSQMLYSASPPASANGFSMGKAGQKGSADRSLSTEHMTCDGHGLIHSLDW